MRMFHQDRSRLNRENVVLTKEINDLRRKAKALSLQQNGVERVSHLSRVLSAVSTHEVLHLSRQTSNLPTLRREEDMLRWMEGGDISSW